MPNDHTEQQNLVSYLLEDHTKSIKALSEALNQFIVNQKIHDQTLNRLTITMDSCVKELSAVKDEVRKIPTIAEDVSAVKKNNKIAMIIYGLLLFFGPAIVSMILKKLLGW
jgi:hypothetical protein